MEADKYDYDFKLLLFEKTMDNGFGRGKER